jgi:diguanylate cyclase (GGDEF)-like protein
VELAVGSVDGIVYAGLAALLLVATIAGFIGGMLCAPALQDAALRRGIRRLQRLYEMTANELERSSRCCEQLAARLTQPLEPGEWSRLERTRQQLAEAWKSLAEKQVPLPPKIDTSQPPRASAFEIEWQLTPVETATKLPDRTAFDQNLTTLLSTSAQHNYPGGLLLVKIDKCDQLGIRYGYTSLATLQNKVAAVIVKGVRETDLVCRMGADVFGILLPSVSPLEGARIAEKLRSAVREHAYRLDDVGTAVLVTASFGYATCLPHDPPSLVIDRATEALEKSQGTGRNQLHVHDASSRVISRVG